LTDSTNTTRVFSQAISRNHFEKIWEDWHFSNNSKQTDSSELIMLQIFRTVYGPKKLLLDEGMILWKGQQKNRAHNSVRML
jgi:hypothetical protein